MKPIEFLTKYAEYFGEKAQLPIAVRYSNEPLGRLDNIAGCLFKQFHKAYRGETVSLGASNFTCGGGKLYTGLGPVPERVYNFVSTYERYKSCPKIAEESISLIGAEMNPKTYINFIRIDKLDDFNDVEGVIFFADPDVVSGLFTWANFDTPDINSVQTPWGSGCSSTITALVNENKKDGKHCFIGLFDVSARVFFRSNVISFSIPYSRFKEMLLTMDECCVGGAPAWVKLKKRINKQ